MTNLRAKKIKRIENDIPELEVIGDKTAELLVVGWGSTGGAVATAVEISLPREEKLLMP